MIIAGDIPNHQFMSKFPLQTFLPLPSLFQGFSNDHQLSQQTCIQDGPSDHAVVHRYPVPPTPPINRLPIELLADIFFLTLRNYAGDWGMQGPPASRNFPGLSFSPGSSSDPMILAQVCRHWRGVALTTPMLWSSMAILCTDRRQHVPLLRTWLERSSDCPLTIAFLEPFLELTEKDQWWPQQSALATDILSLLIAHSHRWKAIDFRFSIRVPVVLASLPAGSLNLLESATILSSQVPTLFLDGLPQLEKVWEVVHACPSFHEGHWEFEYLERRLQNIPWMQLTRIEVTITIGSLFQVLPSCHNLLDLHFTDPCLAFNSIFLPPAAQSSDHLHSRTMFILPFLRTFSIAMQQPSDTIFQQLTLPSLSSFSVRQYKTSGDRPDASSFKDLLVRSQCRLQQYTYDDPSPDGEETLLEILASPVMSSLVHLSVESSVTHKFTKLLAQTSGLLPKLETLAIGGCSTPPGALVEMIRSRRLNVGNCLRYIYLGNWGCHEADLDGFRVLAEQGMLVDV